MTLNVIDTEKNMLFTSFWLVNMIADPVLFERGGLN